MASSPTEFELALDTATDAPAAARRFLLEQRRSANYLAVLTYFTVVLLVLGVVVGVLAAKP